MFRLTIAAVAAVTLGAGPAMAQFPGQPVTAPPIEINRPTDITLTCEQILAEANPLNVIVTSQNQAAQVQAAEAAAAAQKAQNSRRVMGSVAGGLLGGAAQFGMMRGALNNPLARQALTAAPQGANNMANSTATPVATTTAAAPSVEQQRMTVLLGLYTAKKCG